jgi:hypothetical protein
MMACLPTGKHRFAINPLEFICLATARGATETTKDPTSVSLGTQSRALIIVNPS